VASPIAFLLFYATHPGGRAASSNGGGTGASSSVGFSYSVLLLAG